MAQSDYELAAHISGLNQRTEINSIFDSILTHNSGSTAPTVTKAFMMWVDTSNATYYYLKMRNHDNTAWVTLFIYTVSTKVITPFIINSPTTNAIPKINADGTIGNSNIINDASGNVGIGVTPSAWGSGFNAIEGNSGSIVYRSSNSGLEIWQNAYFGSGVGLYKTNAGASRYSQQSGQHSWFTAPSGTAGSAIPWAASMTLNNNGNLLLGTSTDDGVNKLQVNGSLSAKKTIVKNDYNCKKLTKLINTDTITGIVTGIKLRFNKPVSSDAWMSMRVKFMAYPGKTSITEVSSFCYGGVSETLIGSNSVATGVTPTWGNELFNGIATLYMLIPTNSTGYGRIEIEATVGSATAAGDNFSEDFILVYGY